MAGGPSPVERQAGGAPAGGTGGRIDVDPALAIVQGPCGFVYGLIDLNPARISSGAVEFAPRAEPGEYCRLRSAAWLRATPYECDGSRGVATILGSAWSYQSVLDAAERSSAGSISREDLAPSESASEVVQRGGSVAIPPGTGHGSGLRFSYRCPGDAEKALEFETPFRQVFFLK